MIKLSLVACPLLLGALPTYAAAPGGSARLVEFDAPGSATTSSRLCAPDCGTMPVAINAFGNVVGSYTDPDIVLHGFLRHADGSAISFDAPGAGLGANLFEGTLPYAINDLGQIAGLFQSADLTTHGFVREADGSFVVVNVPGASTGPYQGTLLFDINDAGELAGVTIDATNTYHGLVIDHGAYAGFDPPGSTDTFVCQSDCLNLEGIATGYYLDAAAVGHGFLRKPDGALATFDAPGAGTGQYQGTYVTGIDAFGVVSGYEIAPDNTARGFLRYPNGQSVTFASPGAGTSSSAIEAGTIVTSINLFTVAVGQAIDASGLSHGFSRDPFGRVGTFDAPDAGTAANQGTVPTTTDVEGMVTGHYLDRNGLNHGFVWSPATPE